MVEAQRQRWFNAESVLLNPEKGSTVGERLQRFELFLILLAQDCRCAPTIGLQLANAFGVFIPNQTVPLPKPGLLLQNELNSRSTPTPSR